MHAIAIPTALPRISTPQPSSSCTCIQYHTIPYHTIPTQAGPGLKMIPEPLRSSLCASLLEVPSCEIAFSTSLTRTAIVHRRLDNYLVGSRGKIAVISSIPSQEYTTVSVVYVRALRRDDVYMEGFHVRRSWEYRRGV